MTFKKIWAMCIGLLLAANVSAADCANWWLFDKACSNISGIWNEGETGLLVSGYAWHNRSTYDRDKIDSYNELAYGGGLSLYRALPNNNEEMIYAMMFSDSHSKPETHIGYAYMWYWNVLGPLKAGAGLTAGLFSRSDIGSYVPLPFALPLVALKYDKVNLYATYIPGGSNNGNVLFLFSRFDY